MLRSQLGVISKDSFTFQVSRTKRPFTKRGVLATINGLYDPIGFVTPVTIRSKFILHDLMLSSTDWDEPLPQTLKSQWSNWVECLPELKYILIPRCNINFPSSDLKRRELHIFSNAPQRAISAVAYLKMYIVDGWRSSCQFHSWKSKECAFSRPYHSKTGIMCSRACH